MSKISQVIPQFVDSFPKTMSSGVLYVSTTFNSCGHLCCCGCGNEVITPLSPAQWALTYNGRDVSLAKSIGNWTLPCKSHYWIRDGRVDWSRPFTESEIRLNQKNDQADLQALDRTPSNPPGFWERVRRILPWSSPAGALAASRRTSIGTCSAREKALRTDSQGDSGSTASGGRD